ncbi:MAG: hypothetical protein IMHGJWDQ_000588, partial [Candidatus Fervidibacter sp.]
MARFLPVLTETKDERTVLLPSRPLTFEEFVKLFGEDEDVELVDGMVVKRMAAKDPHEDIGGWLLSLLRFYVGEKGLGIIRGSRTPVRITSHRGRLPDVLFVRKERAPIVREEGIYEAPDLVVEILSQGDRPSDLIAMEADYRHIGVAEIWFVDQRRKLVRVLRKRDNRYEERVYRK